MYLIRRFYGLIHHIDCFGLSLKNVPYMKRQLLGVVWMALREVKY